MLAQLRSEIGQLTLDQTFAARERLNQKLLEEAHAVTAGWGIDVTRIEVRDIHPSPEIVSSMEMQMAAERKKRAAILQSEGDRAAQVNAAEGRRAATVLGARGELWLVLPLHACGSCADVLSWARPDGFEEPTALLITREVSRGLAYLHGHGTLHRHLETLRSPFSTPGRVSRGPTGSQMGRAGLSTLPRGVTRRDSR